MVVDIRWSITKSELRKLYNEVEIYICKNQLWSILLLNVLTLYAIDVAHNNMQILVNTNFLRPINLYFVERLHFCCDLSG